MIMAHFAEIDPSTSIVLRTLVVPDDQESRGAQFLAVDLGLGGTWIQTSYNTRYGVHTGGGTPLRINYAEPGFTYDAALDGFIYPKPANHPDWVLDPATGVWNPPAP